MTNYPPGQGPFQQPDDPFGGNDPFQEQPSFQNDPQTQYSQAPQSAPPIPEPQAPEAGPKRIEMGKRTMAFGLDFAAAYFVGMLVSLIPFVNGILPLFFTMLLFLLVRDWLCEGRGIGKNLMGLRVVDIKTGQGPSLKQSIIRNLVLLAPFLLREAVQAVTTFIPIPFFTAGAHAIVEMIGKLYIAVAIPYEAYRAATSPDGRRYGDILAGTIEVEADMNFSNFLPSSTKN
jgi:uncharacterized RDD family membrane protein YckC